MKLKDDDWEDLYLFAKGLADQNVSFEEIEKRLGTKTTDPDITFEIIQQIKRVKYAAQRKNGLTKLGFGGLFLLAGFLITCVNFHADQSFTTVMYGTSTVGLLLVFLGLYEILG